MAYTALYRKWRPRFFREVVGQDHVVRTLLNALKSGRWSHAYLLCGLRGTGKTTIAKILAKAVNCCLAKEGESCGQCSTCREIESGASMDVSEIDAASNRGIDEIRDLREKVRFAPSSAKVRVFIVDEVHMLTNEAFNALLKTLEEPPEQTMFILATTEPHRIPLTIMSRCQRFDFHRIGDREMITRLKEVAGGSDIDIDDPPLDLIVRAADGGMRDALGILDQAAAYGGGKVVLEDIHSILGTVREELLKGIFQALMSGRSGEVLEIIGDIISQGKDLRIFLKELNGYLRNILLETICSQGTSGKDAERLSSVIGKLVRTEQDMRWSTQPRILLEVAMVQAARILGCSEDDGVGEGRVIELTARVRELEALLAEIAGLVKGGVFPGITQLPDSVQGVEVATVAEKPEKVHINKGKLAEKTNRNLHDEDGNDTIKNGNSDQTQANLLLKKIDSRWGDILELARRLCPHIATHLTKGKSWPMDTDGKTLTIAFPRSEPYAPLAVGILDSEINKKELSGLIKSVCKAEFSVHLVESDRKPPRRTKQQIKTVNPEDIEKLFGKDEGTIEEEYEGFDS